MTPALDPADIDRFREVVARTFGLHYTLDKRDLLADVLRQRMATAGCARLDAYLARLASSAHGQGEIDALADKLTVGETFFFRNADHFRALAQHVLPARIRARGHDRRLRILSAGCASGEEAYTIAILVREALPDLEAWDVKITGLDINPAVIERATRARYAAWSLRATTEEAKRRWFRPDGRDFVLDPAIGRMVTFEQRNLVGEPAQFWQTMGCDVVFCRNVLMYFAPETMADVVGRLREALLPQGFLFLGHAETLRGVSHGFHLCHTHDTFYYERREPFEALRATPPARSEADGAGGSLPAAFETTTSWVAAIQRASERIASLADDRLRPDDDAAPPSRPAAPPARSWDLALVLEAMRQERFDDALDLLQALPPDAHHEPDALLLRAVLLTNSGRLPEAEEACSRLLAADELNAGAHYLMALRREHAGDVAGATEHDQTAVYLDPGFAMPHLHLGLAAKRAGDAATAQRELGEALILLAREDASRLLLFGGGFTRETLLQLCRAQLRAAGGAS